MRNRLFVIGLLLILAPGPAFTQVTSGKITYERKTNLYKKFKGEDMSRWIDEAHKIKIDYFDLWFNDSLSVFKTQESDLKEDYSWTTQKNEVYQNRRADTRITRKTVWGEGVYLSDSLYRRTWKITDSKRKIGGYDCRKAIWEVNDSTRIYAWYTDAIAVSTGPESFMGLPGAILGVATEDGGVVYFATRIEALKVDPATMLFKEKVKKMYTPSELRQKLQKEYGKESWGKAMIKGVFDNW